MHRDIKPENILVKYRAPDCNADYLHIKLSDFGFSKIPGQSGLKTGCGTHSYRPPEIRDDDSRYTKAVDIWSLGVVILRLAHDLPDPGYGEGMEWCKKIVEEANDWESDGINDILQHMLVIKAEARYSATDCMREASRLFMCEDRSATPTPASYAAGYRARLGGQEKVRISPQAWPRSVK